MIGPATQVHVWPVDDLVAHVAQVDCLCGPAVEYPSVANGAVLVTHASLDGREAREAAGDTSGGAWKVQEFESDVLLGSVLR